MNLIQLKRMIRSNKFAKKFADAAYLSLTGQLKEEKHCRGDVTPWFIIRPPKSKVGLLGLYIDAIQKISYALENNYKPVIDYENYRTVYSGGQHDESRNIWEWYFEQPFQNSLSEAYAGDYILSRMAGSSNLTDALLRGDMSLLQQYAAVSRGINLSHSVHIYIYMFMDEIQFNKGQKVLGVFCRGSDYTQYKPFGHPVQPDRDDLIKMTGKKMTEWGCDRVFLTTEEKETVDAFQRAFPGKVLTARQELVENFSIEKGLLVEDFKSTCGANQYVSGLGYLTSVVLLSQCDCFLGALAGGSVAALV